MGISNGPLRRVLENCFNLYRDGSSNLPVILEDFYNDEQDRGYCDEWEIDDTYDYTTIIDSSSEDCETELTVIEKDKEIILEVHKTSNSYHCNLMLNRICDYMLLRFERDKLYYSDKDHSDSDLYSDSHSDSDSDSELMVV